MACRRGLRSGGLRQRGYGGTHIYAQIHADKHTRTCTHICAIVYPKMYTHSFCACTQRDAHHIHKHRQTHAHRRTCTHTQTNIGQVIYTSCFFQFAICNHTGVGCMSLSTTPCLQPPLRLRVQAVEENLVVQ